MSLDRTSDRTWPSGRQFLQRALEQAGVDCSTSRMISSFSQAVYPTASSPSAAQAFFEQTVFEGQFGHDLLQS